jgi:hypothetical protein
MPNRFYAFRAALTMPAACARELPLKDMVIDFGQ